MKKLLLLFLFFPVASYADIQHSITSSVKLESLSAATSADKIGSSYSISGNNITTTDSNSAATVGGFGSVTSGVPAIVDTDFTITTSGSAVSLTESLVVGDSIQSATTVTGGVVPALPSLGVTVTGSGGVSGGTITSLSSGVHTCAGTMGAGSSCTAQTIVESVVD